MSGKTPPAVTRRSQLESCALVVRLLHSLHVQSRVIQKLYSITLSVMVLKSLHVALSGPFRPGNNMISRAIWG